MDPGSLKSEQKISFWDVFLARTGHPDRVFQIYELGIVAAICNVTVALGLVYVAWGSFPPWIIMTWLGLVSANALYYMRQNSPKNLPKLTRISRRTLRILCTYAALFALLWAPVSVAVLMIDVPARSSATALLWVLLMGASVVYGAVPVASTIYVCVVLMPGILYGMIWGGPTEMATALAMIVLAVVMVAFALRYGERIRAGEERAAQRARAMALLEEAHSDIRRLAERDPTTDLRNRRALLMMLEAAMLDRGATRHALYLIDLDHFKHVNDAYGHDVGDAYLRKVGAILEKTVGRKGAVSRLGGDEFAVMSNPIGATREIERLGDALLAALNGTVYVGDTGIRIGASIGVATTPEAGHTTGDWLNFADHALRDAKAQGRGTLRVFETKDLLRIQARNSLGAHLQQAVTAGDVSPWYQPQINLQDGQIAGLEVLARWQMEDGQFIPPHTFFELAEMRGLVLELSDQILARVTQDMQTWQDMGMDLPAVAINVHPAQLHHVKQLQQGLKRLIAVTGRADLITLEITEDCIIGRGTEEIPAVLTQLAETGCRISLDDFGTGYASLTHISTLPIDEVKIDRKFIRDLETSQADREIVRSILRIAKLRGLAVVAEGIETARQLDILRSEGCELAQGYYFARPMPESDLREYIAEQARSGIIVADSVA